MKYTSLLNLISCAQASLKLDFEKVPEQNLALNKRDDKGLQLELENGGLLYAVQLSVGTPPQNITVQLDTGSSDLWFTSEANPYCKNNRKHSPKKSQIEPLNDADYPTSPNQIPKSLRDIDCKAFGFFNTSKSSTYKNNGTNFTLSYADTTFASGPWGVDTLSFNGVKVDNVTFGLAAFSNSTTPVFGISLPARETTNQLAANGSRIGPNSYEYSNFPMLLKEQGIVKKIAYSVYLNDTRSKYGSILFGAVDQSKYIGTLYTLPLVNSLYKQVSKPFQFEITLNGIGLQTADKNYTLYDQKLATLLDTGVTTSVLPAKVAALVASKVNGTIDDDNGFIKLDKCPNKKEKRTVVFNFGGAEISIDIRDLTRKIKGKCYLQMQARDDIEFAALGDIFLRHVYVVYNLEDEEISIANANFNYSTPDIQEIVSTVPGAVKAPQYYNTYSVYPTATAVTGDVFTPEATMSMSNNSVALRKRTTLKPSR